MTEITEQDQEDGAGDPNGDEDEEMQEEEVDEAKRKIMEETLVNLEKLGI